MHAPTEPVDTQHNTGSGRPIESALHFRRLFAGLAILAGLIGLFTGGYVALAVRSDELFAAETAGERESKLTGAEMERLFEVHSPRGNSTEACSSIHCNANQIDREKLILRRMPAPLSNLKAMGWSRYDESVSKGTQRETSNETLIPASTANIRDAATASRVTYRQESAEAIVRLDIPADSRSAGSDTPQGAVVQERAWGGRNTARMVQDATAAIISGATANALNLSSRSVFFRAAENQANKSIDSSLPHEWRHPVRSQIATPTLAALPPSWKPKDRRNTRPLLKRLIAKKSDSTYKERVSAGNTGNTAESNAAKVMAMKIRGNSREDPGMISMPIADEDTVEAFRKEVLSRSRQIHGACFGKPCGSNGPGKFGNFGPRLLYNAPVPRTGFGSVPSLRQHPSEAAMAALAHYDREMSSVRNVSTKGVCQTHGARGTSDVGRAPAPPLQAWQATAGDNISRPVVGRRPNVIIIFLDDAGFADLRANVPGPPTRNAPLTTETPRLDEVCAGALRMTNFHVTASTCTPSRASLLTGRTQRRLNLDGVFSQSSTHGLPNTEITIPELLKISSYRTAMAGKWHLGWSKPFHPAFQGFEKIIGIPYSHDMGCLDAWTDCAYSIKNGSHPIIATACSKKEGLTWDMGYQEKCPGQATRTSRWKREWAGSLQKHNIPPVALFESNEFCASKFSSLRPFAERGTSPAPAKGSDGDCSHDVIEQPTDVLQLSDRFASFSEAFIGAPVEETEGRPFFLYLASHLLHSPLMPARRFQLSSLRASLYGDAMVELDNLVGRLLDAVAKVNATNDTLTIFTSDNGPWMNTKNAPWLPQNLHLPHFGSQPGPYTGGGKFTGFEGGHRMPAFFYWPGTIHPGVTRAVLSSTDILPTLATLAGISLPADRGYDGADALPVLLSKASDPSRHRHHSALVVHFKAYRVVLVGPRWKVWLSNNYAKTIVEQKGRVGKTDRPVFDLDADPGEVKPMCKSSNYPIGHPKPPLVPSDMAWVRSIAAREGKHFPEDRNSALLDWWSSNACRLLKLMAERAMSARICDEASENLISVRASGLDPRHPPKCAGCYPCCSPAKFDCRCPRNRRRLKDGRQGILHVHEEIVPLEAWKGEGGAGVASKSASVVYSTARRERQKAN